MSCWFDTKSVNAVSASTALQLLLVRFSFLFLHACLPVSAYKLLTSLKVRSYDFIMWWFALRGFVSVIHLQLNTSTCFEYPHLKVNRPT